MDKAEYDRNEYIADVDLIGMMTKPEEEQSHLNEWEKALAIEMWEYIREHLWDPDFSVAVEKSGFCAKHNLEWYSDCWLCTVHDTCADCPLHSCSRDISGLSSYMQVVVNHDKGACEEIIEAIRSVEVE